MDLQLSFYLAETYKSKSQKARVITEAWANENLFCPSCGHKQLTKYSNNKPVADFYCALCREEYELKSKEGTLTNIVADGAYLKMIERITSATNPNFFFLNYSADACIDNVMVVPKQFFTPSVIIQRKPLAATAKRSGWVGCNINLSCIPDYGKVFLVQGGSPAPSKNVIEKFQKTTFLREKKTDAKGWLLDIMVCLDRISNQTFTLDDVYSFEEELKRSHPENNFIKDKIRQQLQQLRDKGLIEFERRGHYRKVTA